MAVTNAREWKKATANIELTLPSGNVALCRRPGLKAIIVSGKVPNSILPMMKGALAGKKLDLRESEITEDQIYDLMKLSDIIVVECVVDPEVHQVPGDPKERDENLLYVDEVDDEDKNFIFQWAVGGTSDVATFREQARSVLDSLATSEDVPQAPE